MNENDPSPTDKKTYQRDRNGFSGWKMEGEIYGINAYNHHWGLISFLLFRHFENFNSNHKKTFKYVLSSQ